MYMFSFLLVILFQQILGASGGSDDGVEEPPLKSSSRVGNLVMSSFVNIYGVKIRTYASRVKNPRGHIILVHGVCSHFRSSFCNYNLEWYLKHSEERMDYESVITFEKELCYVFPDLESLNGRSIVNEDPLHGKNAFKLTPRFLYEGSFVHVLNKLGFSVYGLDLQSHGLSGSRYKQRCYVEDFDDFVYDVIQFTSIIKRGKFDDPSEVWDDNLSYHDDRHDNLPYNLIGLSLGGNIVLKSQIIFDLNAIRPNKFIDGMIALNSLLSTGFYSLLNFIKSLYLMISSILMPGMTIFYKVIDDYIQGVDFFMRKNDPLFYSNGLSARMLISIYHSANHLTDEMKYYPQNLPTLFIHSKDDPISGIEGPKYYMENFFKDSKFVNLIEVYDKTHIITPIFAIILRAILEKWFDKFDNIVSVP